MITTIVYYVRSAISEAERGDDDLEEEGGGEPVVEEEETDNINGKSSCPLICSKCIPVRFVRFFLSSPPNYNRHLGI